MHKEGTPTLLLTGILFSIILVLSKYFFSALFPFLLIGFVILYGIILWFFRNPSRSVEVQDDGLIYAPADGKVVVIEKTNESEYFKDERLQVSIFMSPLNVHVNRNPISGQVKFAKYHAGKYLTAWNPKSSTENERTTMVVENSKATVLFRQIAGALARRIVYYIEEGDVVRQGEEMGFIKFGSRVDLFLPLNSDIQVNINDVVAGAETVIAKIP